MTKAKLDIDDYTIREYLHPEKNELVSKFSSNWNITTRTPNLADYAVNCKNNPTQYVAGIFTRMKYLLSTI